MNQVSRFKSNATEQLCENGPCLSHLTSRNFALWLYSLTTLYNRPHKLQHIQCRPPKRLCIDPRQAALPGTLQSWGYFGQLWWWSACILMLAYLWKWTESDLALSVMNKESDQTERTLCSSTGWTYRSWHEISCVLNSVASPTDTPKKLDKVEFHSIHLNKQS